MPYPRVFAIGALILLAFVVLPVWVLVSTRAGAQEETGTCPEAQLIDQFSGNGNQDSDTFETTTNQFRVSYETTNTAEGSGNEGILVINVRDADDPDQGSKESISQDGSGTGESFVNTPPGTYFLDITAGDVDYRITVEQCGGGSPSTNPGGEPTGGESPQKTSPSPPPQKTTPPPPPPQKTTLPPPPTPAPAPPFKAGGAEAGPVPLLPNGSCPKEFPVKQGKACYAT